MKCEWIYYVREKKLVLIFQNRLLKKVFLYKNSETIFLFRVLTFEFTLLNLKNLKIVTLNFKSVMRQTPKKKFSNKYKF